MFFTGTNTDATTFEEKKISKMLTDKIFELRTEMGKQISHKNCEIQKHEKLVRELREKLTKIEVSICRFRGDTNTYKRLM